MCSEKQNTVRCNDHNIHNIHISIFTFLSLQDFNLRQAVGCVIIACTDTNSRVSSTCALYPALVARSLAKSPLINPETTRYPRGRRQIFPLTFSVPRRIFASRPPTVSSLLRRYFFAFRRVRQKLLISRTENRLA